MAKGKLPKNKKQIKPDQLNTKTVIIVTAILLIKEIIITFKEIIIALIEKL